MIKSKEQCCDKKGMHGYRCFLCVLLVMAVGFGILYLICCGNKHKIPEEGTLVKDIKESGRIIKDDIKSELCEEFCDDECEC